MTRIIKSKKALRLTLSVLLLVGLSRYGHAQTGFVDSLRRQELIRQGKDAYETRCSGCHGMQGNGKGPGAAMLDPKPRDFTQAVFKLKTTPLGSMPTNDDLLKVINQGVIGTSMPSFILVSDTEKRAIIEYIKTFAPDSWKKQNDTESIPAFSMPQDVFTKKDKFLSYARVGRVWFQELGCITCHGVSGRGDGPSAATLLDAWGNPIRPANLHKPYIKRGYTIQDVAYSIAQGVDGTPMPAHATILEGVEEKFPEIKEKRFIWELAAYVFYLRGEAAGLMQGEIAPIPESRIPPEEVKPVVGKYFE